jgi:hypothetical protein
MLLNLSDTSVGDSGLAVLNGLTKLRIVVLDGTAMTSQGLANLKKALPGVRFIRFGAK